MTKQITIKINVTKEYYAEVPDDFDFDADGYDLIEDREANDSPVSEDWESLIIEDDETGDEYSF